MTLKLAAALIAAGLVLAPVASHAADSSPMKLEMAKEVIDDATITTKLRADLARDKATSAMTIKVETSKGVVKLSGDAKTKADADRAALVAKGAAGVARVENNIRVTGK